MAPPPNPIISPIVTCGGSGREVVPEVEMVAEVEEAVTEDVEEVEVEEEEEVEVGVIQMVQTLAPLVPGRLILTPID